MSALLKGQPGERRLLLGNEAIVRGALEAGVALVTTYPGTPASEIGDRCYEISRQTDLYFEYSVNEKVALEVAAGAAASGWRTLCAMKHVGLNVAADTLMTLGYVGVKGGMVIVSADDPSLFSSQNEQDNRYYAKLAGLPMLEPATPEEAKAMTRLAPRGQARALAETSSFNEISGRGAWGVVASGVAGTYVADALKELGLADQVRLLKLGFTHPLPEVLLGDFLAPLEQVLAV